MEMWLFITETKEEKSNRGFLNHIPFPNCWHGSTPFCNKYTLPCTHKKKIHIIYKARKKKKRGNVPEFHGTCSRTCKSIKSKRLLLLGIDPVTHVSLPTADIMLSSFIAPSTTAKAARTRGICVALCPPSSTENISLENVLLPPFKLVAELICIYILAS
jgi:hypothetical protein